MPEKLSIDISRLLSFELAHGNEVLNFGKAEGYHFIELCFPFHVNTAGFREALSNTIYPWEWGSQHYEEKYEGFRSTLFPCDAIVV